MVSHRVSAGAGRGSHGITCRAIMARLCSLFVLAMTILGFAPEGRAGQAACKPGSVPAVAGGGWPFIWDARCRTPHATYPGGDAKTRLPLRPRRAAPTRSCSRWGLPCRARRRARGALLPHPFTLADANAGGLLSVALSLGSPPPGVTRHRVSVEPGLSSPRAAALPPGAEGGHPAVWPASAK